MSQRHRVAVAACALSAALFLAVPSASRAAGARQARLPAAGFVERVWSWIAELWPAGGSPAPASRWEKEGSVISPEGQPHTTATSPTSPPDDSK